MKPRLFKDLACKGEAVSANNNGVTIDGVTFDGVTGAAIKSANLVELAALLAGDDRLYILHAGKKYCLRITAQNKLILTA